MQCVSDEDNLHDVLNPVPEKKKKKKNKKNIVNLSSAELAERHYENTPIQIYRKIHLQNQVKNSDIFRISAQNIDCGYSLEPPRIVNPSFTI